MGAEPARVLEYELYNFGSAAPAREIFPEEAPRAPEVSRSREQVRQRERAKAVATAENAQGVSLFAIVGSFIVIAMMIFVVLAQISYNEVGSETARLNAQLAALNEQERRLRITFESVIDIKEIERYSRDVLGMSMPNAFNRTIPFAAAGDRAEVLRPPERGSIREFGAFISSLLSQFG